MIAGRKLVAREGVWNARGQSSRWEWAQQDKANTRFRVWLRGAGMSPAGGKQEAISARDSPTSEKNGMTSELF
jgi:hypothetical protein